MISIVIPGHDCAGTIERCLRSIVDQARDDVEIIVVDDGSADATAVKVAAFGGGHGLRLLRNPERRGASCSRNRGIAAARGEWLMFVDADDELPPHAIATLAREAAAPDVDLVVGAHLKRSAGGKTTLNRHGCEESFTADAASLAQYVGKYAREPYSYTLLVHCWGRLYRAAVVAQHGVRFDEDLEQLEDVSFNFNFLARARGVRYVDTACYIHDIGGERSMSARSGTELEPVARMGRAYEPIGRFLTARCGLPHREAEKTVQQLLFTTSVIWLQRIGRRFAGQGIRRLAARIGPIVRAPLVRASMPAYRRMPRDSRVVYWAMLFGSPTMCAFALYIHGLLRREAGR